MIKCMRAETGDISDLKRPNKKAERKFDGTRILIEKTKDNVLVQNKDGRIYTVRLPDVVDAALKISEDYTVDAEAVYLDETGEEDFTACQSLLRQCQPQEWSGIAAASSFADDSPVRAIRIRALYTPLKGS